jgi:NTE family protein
MKLINKDLILEEIPLFSGLSTTERNIIKSRSHIVECKKGEIIYKEGSNPTALYCVVLGRIEIYTLDQHGNKKVLEYLHRGKYFGIISLLTKEPHSVTAVAINDCLLFTIEASDFDFVLKRIPRLAIDLSQTLSRRLKRKDIHQKIIFESTIISVFSSYSQAGKSIYALNLSLSLAKETHKSLIILDIAPNDKVHSLSHRLGINECRIFDLSGQIADNPARAREFILKNQFGIDLTCFHYDPEDDSCVGNLLGILSFLVNDYHYIILDLPSLMDRAIFRILNQSDLIHILTSPAPLDLKRTNNLIERLKNKFNFHEDKIKIIINEYKLSKLDYEEQSQILNTKIFATLPKIDFESGDKQILDEPNSEYSKAIRRISRQLGDCQVGLVLGVGVAYGFCHVGVLRVIEEQKIPIDIIAGSSIGAVIASLWALGKSSGEILEITKEFREPKHIWGLIDLTFPLLGFIKGNKLQKFLNKYLGNKTFYDLKIPLKIIASDVKRKEPKILDRGLLMDAIMASCTMPGVFTPFKFKDEFLFDGGIINPLPTEALWKSGVRKIIAVNVTPSKDDVLRQYEKIKEQITTSIQSDVKRKSLFNLNRYFRENFKTNILDIIFSSIEILQSEVAQKEAQLADVVLHPDTSGLYWLELYRAGEFAKRGEEEARKNLDKIWQLIND